MARKIILPGKHDAFIMTLNSKAMMLLFMITFYFKIWCSIIFREKKSSTTIVKIVTPSYKNNITARSQVLGMLLFHLYFHMQCFFW